MIESLSSPVLISILFSSLTALVIGFYNLVLKHHLNYIRKMRQLPCIEPRRFLVGNLYEFWVHREKTTEYIKELFREVKRKGDFCILWLSYYPIVFVASWRYNSKILGNKKFLDRGWPAKKITNEFSGLVSLANAEWKAHRNLVSPSYAPNVLENFIPTLLEHIQLMGDDFEASNEKFIEPLPILERHIISIVLETSMGLKDEVNDEDRFELKNSLKHFLNSQFDRILRIYTWNELTNKLYTWFNGIDDGTAGLRKYAMQIIEARLNKRLARNREQNGDFVPTKERNRAFLDNLLETFMDQKSHNGQKFDFESILNELVNIMATSYETIINTTMWFLHNMACNPLIQEQLYEELLDFNEKNECVTISQINELTFLDQCVKENLRIHPPVAFMMRKTEEEIEIGGYSIPKDTLTATSIYFIHHDEEIFSNPEKFDPSRFEPENLDKIPPGGYIPFGDGPRRCIGEKLALLEAKVIFSNIIKRFRVVPFEPEKVQVKLDLLTRSEQPLKFSFIRRDKN
ncbi:cytochrome P450 4c21-like [Brevipalpus obovatus]|uniref:cytochrome P450 4c21-like n=1 Tax=Brevipalpus obovatus TaxID=246614 RepID=UPI003D9EDF74